MSRKPSLKKTIGVSVVLVLVILGMITPIVAASEQVIGQPGLEVYAPDNVVTSGEETTLDLYVSNDGQITRAGPSQFTQRVTTARDVTVEARAGQAPVRVKTGRYPVGTVAEGPAGPVPIRIVVNENASPGTYRIPVQVRYSYTRFVNYEQSAQGPTNVEFVDSSVTRTKYVTLQIDKQANFEIMNVQSDVQVGEEGPVEVTVQNTGSEVARDTVVNLESTSEDVRLGSGKATSRYVGTWQPGENRTVTYEASVSESGEPSPYALRMAMEYTTADGVSTTSDSLSLGVIPAPKQTFSLRNVSSTLRIGEEGVVTGTIQNNGPQQLNHSVVAIQSSSPHITLKETEYALADLQPGEKDRFQFTAEVSDSAEGGYQQLTFTIKYTTRSGMEMQSDPLKSRVRIRDQQKRFAVAVEDNVITAGGQKEIAVAVTNQRNVTLRNINAKAYADSPLSLSSSEAFVDELSPGETETIVLKASLGGDAVRGSYPLQMDFQYEMPDGESQISEVYSVGLKTQERQQRSPSPPLLIGGVIVVLLVAIGLYRYLRH